MQVLQHVPLWLIFIVTTSALLAAGEVGRRLGNRVAGVGGENVGALEGAVLGLVTLMISFTFGMALSRFEDRRDAVVVEANAIGTTALRARMLPSPLNAESVRLLKEYTTLRLELSDREMPASRFDATIGRSNALQEQLWQIAIKAKTADPAVVPTGQFITTLNEMIDAQSKYLANFRNRVPDIVLFTLYSISIVGIGFAGYADGLTTRVRRIPIMVTGLAFAVAIWLIQDLDRPESGFLRTDLRPLIDVADGLNRVVDH